MHLLLGKVTADEASRNGTLCKGGEKIPQGADRGGGGQRGVGNKNLTLTIATRVKGKVWFVQWRIFFFFF